VEGMISEARLIQSTDAAMRSFATVGNEGKSSAFHNLAVLFRRL